MIGKLVQFNPKYFEGNMNEYGCGLIVSDLHPHSHPLLRLRPPLRPHLHPLPLPHPRPSGDWVEVLWSDGKIHWEFVDYLREIAKKDQSRG